MIIIINNNNKAPYHSLAQAPKILGPGLLFRDTTISYNSFLAANPYSAIRPCRINALQALPVLLQVPSTGCLAISYSYSPQHDTWFKIRLS